MGKARLNHKKIKIVRSNKIISVKKMKIFGMRVMIIVNNKIDNYLTTKN